MRLIALMGGTTKQTTSTKLVQWGSGLKTRLAWLIKNNLDFHISSVTERVEITRKPETIRGGEDF